jgi:hypothetical protein
MKKIKIYRTGWELYQGRGVWDTYYTDWTTDKNLADKQFLELTELYKNYPAGLHRVLKVESSELSVDSMGIEDQRTFVEKASRWLKDNLIEHIGKDEVGDWTCEAITVKGERTLGTFIMEFQEFMIGEVLINLRTHEAVADMIKDDVHKRNFNDSYFRFMATMFAELDSHPKNSFPFYQDDMDTCQGIPNFPKGEYAVNVGKKEYLGYIYDEFVKVPEDGYYAYDFALVNNGKVIAIGYEQGRCGGVYSSCRDKDFEDWLKKSPVYDKVKHLPIATEDELEEPIYKHFDSHTEYENYMKNQK